MRKSKPEDQAWFKLIFEDGTQFFISHPDIYPQNLLHLQVREKYEDECKRYGGQPKKIKEVKRSSYRESLQHNNTK